MDEAAALLDKTLDRGSRYMVPELACPPPGGVRSLDNATTKSLITGPPLNALVIGQHTIKWISHSRHKGVTVGNKHT